MQIKALLCFGLHFFVDMDKCKDFNKIAKYNFVLHEKGIDIRTFVPLK